MLYHPNSPYYQQFLHMSAGKNKMAVNNNASTPAAATVSAAQAKAANSEK